MTNITFNNVGFTLITCCRCGLQFAIPENWEAELRRNHANFKCPSDHNLSFAGESDLERLKREKEQSAIRFQASLNEERHLRLVAEKERDSERRKRRKVEKRIAAGVCPCCNRTFEDLARHMSTKHRGYALPPAKPKQIEGTVQ